MRIAVFSIIAALSIACVSANKGSLDEPKALSEKMYAKLFLLRRKENKELLGIISNEKFYERKFKMIEAAYGKILKILEEAKAIIVSSNYDPENDKFPKDNRLIDALTVVLENACLFSDMVLYFPDISYRVLHSRHESSSSDPSRVHWRDLINWCLDYSKSFYNRIVDAKSQHLLSLADQEINPEKRTTDFINPYRDLEDHDRMKNTHKKKPPKKLKKGPKLAGGSDEL